MDKGLAKKKAPCSIYQSIALTIEKEKIDSAFHRLKEASRLSTDFFRWVVMTGLEITARVEFEPEVALEGEIGLLGDVDRAGAAGGCANDEVDCSEGEATIGWDIDTDEAFFIEEGLEGEGDEVMGVTVTAGTTFCFLCV